MSVPLTIGVRPARGAEDLCVGATDITETEVAGTSMGTAVVLGERLGISNGTHCEARGLETGPNSTFDAFFICSPKSAAISTSTSTSMVLTNSMPVFEELPLQTPFSSMLYASAKRRTMLDRMRTVSSNQVNIYFWQLDRDVDIGNLSLQQLNTEC